MKLFKRTLAALFALGMSAASIPAAQSVGTGSILTASAADQDITSQMKWGTLRIGGGGFVSGIVTGKKEMYARTDVGGAYKYNYETESWEQLLGFVNEADRGLLSVDAMAIDPTDDDTVYFLCGCAYFSAEKTVIFKTTDGGKTMKEIDVTNLIKVMGNGDGRQCGESIAVDPDNSNVIYAGGDVTADANSKSALIKSTDGGETWEPVIGYDDLGLFDSTTKWPTWGSITARSVTDGAYQTQNGVAAIQIVDGKVYVATSKTGVANVHVASTKDDKFTVLSKDLPTDVFPSRINADSNGNLIITYIGALAFGGGTGGAYKYDPKAGTVTDIAPTGNGFGEIYADPKNPDHLVATTCGVWSGQMYTADAWDRDAVAWGDQFFRSTDGGKTWEGITPGKEKSWNGPLEADYIQTGGYDWIMDKAIHWVGSMVLDPRDPSRAFLTSGNGSFVCTDVWGELPTYTFHPDGIEEVVALDFVSTSDGLDLSAIGDYDGFVHQSMDKIGLQYKPNMGSTSAIAVCPQNTDVWARIAEGDNGAGYYTTDRGKTWNAFTPSTKGGKLAIAQIDKSTYRIFNTGKNDGGVAYSDDWGKTWNSCEGIPSQYGSKPTMLLVEPDDPNTVYAYATYFNSSWHYSKPEPTAEDAQYKLCVSTDGGKTFTSTDICMYDQCDSAGRIAYLEKGHLILGGGWYGMYDVTVKDGKVTSTKIDSVNYCKTVGYGAPEKEGGLNTIYFYGKTGENSPEGIYRSTDGGKSWACINTDHLYGGTGNGNFLVGDMDEFGKVYMSTVGCGIVVGYLSDGSDIEPSETIWGDADDNGEVKMNDVVLIMQSIANNDKYGINGTDKDHITAKGQANANVYENETSGITVQDALQVQKFLLEKITSLDPKDFVKE